MITIMSEGDDDDINGIYSYLFIMCVLQIGYDLKLTEEAMNTLLVRLAGRRWCMLLDIGHGWRAKALNRGAMIPSVPCDVGQEPGLTDCGEGQGP